MKKRKEKNVRRKELTFLAAFVFLEFLLFSLLFFYFPGVAHAEVGENNASLNTFLDIGNSFPEIQNITINGGNSIDLVPNSTVEVMVQVFVVDYNGDVDVNNVRGEFFDNIVSSYGSADDNNNHYSNQSCLIDNSYGDAFQLVANCTYHLEYYANNQTWNFTAMVNDTLNSQTFGSELETVNTLLAFGLPDTIDYGEVNATAVSSEVLANVTNFGNVAVNLSLSGYGSYVGDGNAMNCTLGAVQNISIGYEKYNLTGSNDSSLSLAQFEALYLNLSSSPVVRRFDLEHRQNDTSPYLDDTNTTYWRIYVPIGVAGTCSGNIVFGAVESAGS